VFLDVSHRGRDYILERLPKLHRQLLSFQDVDITKEPMEVAPTAHYSMGGVVVDPETHATDVPGLYAAGECASGLHGANRLGGNSLVDLLVFGRRAGEDAAASAASSGRSPAPVAGAIRAAEDELSAAVHPGDQRLDGLRRALRLAMWERCGVVRDAGMLDEALDRLDGIRDAAIRAAVEPERDGWSALAHALDLRSGLLAAEATVRAALQRTETRGAHNRSDFPDEDPRFRVNLHVRLAGDGLQIHPEPVPPVPTELEPWLAAEAAELTGEERLLE
jgi:succinate dehydrogenase / fumarate reductase flavoprotein subunit